MSWERKELLKIIFHHFYSLKQIKKLYLERESPILGDGAHYLMHYGYTQKISKYIHCPMGWKNLLDYNFPSLFTQVEVERNESMVKTLRTALQKDKSNPALQFCLLDKSQTLQQCCDLWINLIFSPSSFLQFLLNITFFSYTSVFAAVFCSCPQWVYGKQGWIFRPYSRPFVHPVIRSCPFLHKLCKVSIWCKTLRKQIE